VHLNFLDTSPLKVFASSLRSKLLACWVDNLLAELTHTNAQDRLLLLAQLATGLLGGHAASSASKLKITI
jgi:hypothetical protein